MPSRAILFGIIWCLLSVELTAIGSPSEPPPNILFAISDDQSFPHASSYGDPSVFTPAFDRVAREGVLFLNAITASPGCSPSRASILTGRYPWQNQHAGTHASSFSSEIPTYPRLLRNAGYHVGYTGKGWGPGNYKVGGFKENPAGTAYQVDSKQTPSGIRRTDYAASFAKFLQARKPDQPFCFWYGASEPHRSFGEGIGVAHGGHVKAVNVPDFLPDTPEIRSDLLDYAYEIEWFDRHLGRMLRQLEDLGELERTIIVVTSDNGMAFPRAKANCYEYGIHMPLAICWPARAPGGRVVKDLVSLTDLMPTFLESCGVAVPAAIAGKSLLPILTSGDDGQVDPARRVSYSARERHSSSRWNNLGFPQRCIRSHQYLYIKNFHPERWPAGAPQKYGSGGYAKNSLDALQLGPIHAAYHDIDACPTMAYLLQNRSQPDIQTFFQLAVGKRPAVELYDIVQDPACLNNLAEVDRFVAVRDRLGAQLAQYLKRTGDPRSSGSVDEAEVFETYRRYSRIRRFPKPDWAK